MNGCLEEATLQSYFDGELSCPEMEAVTGHINSCPRCADAAHVVDSEMTTLSVAFAAEGFQTVPSGLLRERLDRAIAELCGVMRH